MDRPIGTQHQRDFDQSESSACCSEASCQLSAVICGIINPTGVLVHCNKIHQEEEEEEKKEEEEQEEQEQDGDDVRRSPWLNLVTGASGGESAQEYWDCDFRTLL